MLINSSHFLPFYPQRGLRQADPLSLYLFILYKENFSSPLSSENHDSGLNGGGHLLFFFFVDDCFL